MLAPALDSSSQRNYGTNRILSDREENDKRSWVPKGLIVLASFVLLALVGTVAFKSLANNDDFIRGSETRVALETVRADASPSSGFIAKTTSFHAAFKSDIDTYGCQNLFIFRFLIHHWTAYKVISCDTASDPIVITGKTVTPTMSGDAVEQLFVIKVPSSDVMTCEEYGSSVKNNGETTALKTVPHCYFGSYQWPNPIPKYHFNPIEIKVSRVSAPTGFHAPNQLWSVIHNLGPSQDGVCPQVAIKSSSSGGGYIFLKMGGCWYSNTDAVRMYGYYMKPDGGKVVVSVNLVNTGGSTGSLSAVICFATNITPNGGAGSASVYVTAASGGTFPYAPLTDSKCSNNDIRLVY